MAMVTDEQYEAVMATIGEIPGWEVVEIWGDGFAGSSYSVLLSLAETHWANLVIDPLGAYAQGWLLDAEGPRVWARDREFATAIWKAHAAFLWQQKRRPQ